VLCIQSLLQLLDLEFIELGAALLGALQVLDLAEGLGLVLAPEALQLDLPEPLLLGHLVVQPANLSCELVHLEAVLLVLDAEVVVGLSGFGLEGVGCVILGVEFEAPGIGLRLLLLDDLEECLVLLDQVCVLPQEHLDLVLELLQLEELAVHEHELLVDGHQLVLVLARPHAPVVGLS
jgi:hypothetical protein